MSRGRQPEGFAPGAELQLLDSKLLEQVGFQPGFPLFGTPNGEQASDLQKIIHALTFEPDMGEAQPRRLRPVILQIASVPDGSERGEVISTLMEIREFRRAWFGEQPYWYLSGKFAGCPRIGGRHAHRPDDMKWYIDRKRIGICRMHVLFRFTVGYVQFVPIGVTSGKPLPADVPTEGFRWGDLSSKTLPPKR